VEVATDGGTFAPWLSRTTLTTATYAGAPGHIYRFRVRATDLHGNMSDYVPAEPIAIESANGGLNPNPGPLPWPAATDAAIAIRTAQTKRGVLSLNGTVARELHGRLVITWQTKLGRRLYTARANATARDGRFRVRLRIPPKARRAKAATVTIAYAGDAQFPAQSRRFRIRTR
jgi:hypothetical protein